MYKKFLVNFTGDSNSDDPHTSSLWGENCDGSLGLWKQGETGVI